MESSISESKENNPLTESQEIRKKAREELNVQLQGYLNNQPIENPTEENIEDEVNRLMEEVDLYEKNYVPKDLDENEINELNKFEEEFGEDDLDEDDISEDENEIKEKNNIKNNININIKDKKNDDNKYKKNIKEKMKNKRSNIDMDLDLKNLENIVKKDYKTKDKKNKKEGNIMEDKEIQDLYNEYDKLLDKELEQEVEKEFKPKLDIKDIKRADLLLKVDPLINEALVQGRIKKDELVLFIDYYEIFSLSYKAKKFTSQQLQKIDELCYKKNNNEKNKENNDENNEKNKKKEKYDLNDENAIDKLTSEIEKGLQDSEEILMKKLDYEKYKMELSKKQMKNKKIENKINNDDKNTLNKNNNSSNSTKTIKTNYTLNNDLSRNKIITNHEKNRPISGQSDISSFTQEELNSVPRYSLPGSKKEKIKNKKISNEKNKLNISSDKTNKTFYPNDINNKNKDNINIINQKPKTPYNILPNNINNKKANNSNNSSTTSISIPSGKKTIPPLKKSKNAINLKSKTDQNIDLFDDNANPISLGKYRGARKDMVKLKMGGKSKVHELFVNKPRNIEENEKIKQKFMEFIKEGKENKKYPDVNGTKKSIARKKIEDAQNYNKSNK